MARRLLLLSNSLAGRGRAKTDLAAVLALLTGQSFQVTVYPLLPQKGLTSRAMLDSCIPHGCGESGNRGGDASPFAAIVCMGGDGTLHYLAGDLLERGLGELPVCYIPRGSTNDFAFSLGLAGLSLEKLVGTLGTGRATPVDTGLFCGKSFSYIAAFGAFTKTSWAVPTRMKNLLGRAAYLLGGFFSLRENLCFSVKMKVVLDGRKGIEGRFVYGGISNSRSTGGFRLPILQNARLDDGLFEVLLVRRPESLRALLRTLVHLARGVDDGNIVFARAHHVQFEVTEETPRTEGPVWTVDGECGGAHGAGEIAVLPSSVTYVLPPDAAV